MKKVVSVVVSVSMVGMSVMPGCATMEGSAGTGALLGGLAGGIIGHQSGSALEGALIGALVGAAAGAIVHDVRDRRMRTAQETYQTYNYQPDQGFQLNIEGGHIEPPQFRPGSTFDGRVDYAVMGTGGQVPVREQFVLMKDDKVLGTVYDDSVTRADGTWEKTVKIEFPENAPEGTYRLANTVSARDVTKTNYTYFEVLPKTAQGEPGTTGGRGVWRIAVVSAP